MNTSTIALVVAGIIYTIIVVWSFVQNDKSTKETQTRVSGLEERIEILERINKERYTLENGNIDFEYR